MTEEMSQTNPKNDDIKPKKKTFELVSRCQALSAEILSSLANSPKEYRISICKQIQNLSYELIHTIRIANSFSLGSPERKQAQQDAYEKMERINDLLPVLKKLKCITPIQEAEICKRLSSLQFGYTKWLRSDLEKEKGGEEVFNIENIDNSI